MSTIKTFKKGEVLFKEGDKPQFVYLIQSGSVSLHLSRQKTNIELLTLGSLQVVGEHALSGATTHPHSAVALSETKALELPLEALRGQIDGGSQVVKLLVKGLTDKLKLTMAELKSSKMERDNTPCPADQVAKIFGTLYHVCKSKGELQKDGVIKVPWRLAKHYAQRVFLESPKRFENAANVFVKLGLANYEMVKSEEEPDSPPEIGFFHLRDLALIEQFFEFYQHYHFKGGKEDILRSDDRVILMVQLLVELGAAEKVDRFGAVHLDYQKVVEAFKDKLGLNLLGDHFNVMEQKGAFVKRQSGEKGVTLQFEFKEFERLLKVWKVLREVERWNEKGSVDPNEPVVEPKRNVNKGPECPKCHHALSGTPKFCPECGHKLAAEAA